MLATTLTKRAFFKKMTFGLTLEESDGVVATRVVATIAHGT